MEFFISLLPPYYHCISAQDYIDDQLRLPYIAVLGILAFMENQSILKS